MNKGHYMMRIKEIKRKVTGKSYDNIELTVSVDPNMSIDDAIKFAVEVDEVAKKMLKACYENDDKIHEKEIKKQNMLDKIEYLKSAIENERINNLPF